MPEPTKSNFPGSGTGEVVCAEPIESLAPEQSPLSVTSLQMLAVRKLPFASAAEIENGFPSVNAPRIGSPEGSGTTPLISETNVTVAAPNTLVQVTTSLTRYGRRRHR
jgi:hypothetical protein